MIETNPYLNIRELLREDCATISKAFEAQGWTKQISQYQKYFEEQVAGDRKILVGWWNADFAGYLTIMWESNYPFFGQHDIPEIVDLNVLKKYQRKGIASSLIQEAEKAIFVRSKIAGIGVGLTSDYGPAQRLYYQLGYQPDGYGVHDNGKLVGYGDSVIVGDDLAIYLTKYL